MSGKAEPPGAQASPAPLPNLLLYVPQHPGGPVHPAPNHHHHQQMHPGQCVPRRGIHRLDPTDPGQTLAQVGGVEKKTKEDLADRTIQQIHYQAAFQNGTPLQKNNSNLPNILSMPDKNQSTPPIYNCKPANETNVESNNTSNNNNCIPGLSNNTFSIGIQGGQRIMQAEILNSFDKNSEKRSVNHLIQAGLCGHSFLELNQDLGQNVNSSANLSRSESVRSEAGESCSSLSSGDSQNDCPGNILILPGQMSGAIHGQQILNQNQIVLSQNRTVLNHGSTPGNIVIANNSNAVLSNHIDNNMQTTQMTMPNYQFLEQNVAQQSIVNRSISIVNRQIISNREGSQPVDTDTEGHAEDGSQGQRRLAYDQGVGSNFASDGMVRQGVSIGMDGEIVIVNNLPHQLVRTPGGIVLGMMPGAKHSAVGSSASVGVVNGVNNSVGGGVQSNVVPGDGGRQTQADGQPPNKAHVIVPFGWNRIIHLSSVVYTSPSGAALGSLEEIKGYLQAAGTCKCGLDCPLRPECIFNFDPKVVGKPSETRPEQSKICSYNRKMMAASQTNSHLPSVPTPPKIEADQPRKQVVSESSVSKKRKRKANPYSGASLFQILGQRDGVQAAQHQQNHQPQNLQHHQQQYQVQEPLQQHQQMKERIWINSPQQMPNSPVNTIPHPNQTGSPTVPQVRFNSPHLGGSPSNFGSGSLPMTVQQSGIMLCQGTPQNVKPDGVNSPAHQAEFQMQGRHPNGPQLVSINGNSLQSHNMPADQEQKVLHHQIMLNNQQVANIGSISQNNNQLSGISHVIGPNGQIIGIQTSNIPRSQSMGNIASNDEKGGVKCSAPVDVKSEHTLNANNNPTMNPNDDSKPLIHMQSQNMQLMSNGLIVPSSQPSMQNNQLQLNPCNVNVINGANIQQLPPEVIQRINQQQQIFIQQNQKQMELAMKGIKTHVMSPSSQPNIGIRTNAYTDVNQGTNQNQLVVSGNTVMMVNHQRMPPWQINRMNKLQQANQNQAMQNIPNKQEMRPSHMETAESAVNISFQGNSNQQNSDNSGLGPHLVAGQNAGAQNIYSRVPPLHHHSPQQTWPEEVNKKKPKLGKSAKKPRQYNGIESQRINNATQGGTNSLHNSDQRNTPDYRSNQMQNLYPNMSSPSPSFMEDPSGYLAQQTALMNSTISRQVGLNMMASNNPIQNNMNPKNNSHHNDMRDGNNFNGNQKPFNSRSGNGAGTPLKPDCGNLSSSKNSENPGYNGSPTQSNIPDSSISLEKPMDHSNNLQQLHSHCQGCIAEMNACKDEESARNMNSNNCESRFQGAGFQAKLQNFMHNISSSKSEPGSEPGTPSPNQSSDENPVTSSTFIDRPGSRSNNMSGDGRGPIQGGIISTSNGSPLETFSLPELSPTPSNSSRNTDTPQSRNSGSIQISSSCPFTIPSPAYSNQGSSRESINSNPATPSPGHSQGYVTYSSPGPIPNQGPNHLIITSHINSDGVNTYSLRNTSSNDSSESTPMQVDPQSGNNRIVSQNNNNGMSGYYVPSHMTVSSPNSNQGRQMYVHTNGIVTTMASGHTLSRNTITSVLAGKAQTATTSVNVSSALPYIYPPNPSSANSQNQNIQFPHMNSPQNYTGHVSGSPAQTLVSKSPLEMVQSVVSSIQVAQSNCAPTPIASQPATQSQAKNNMNNHGMHSGHILMPSNGQFLVTGSGQGHVMAPPPPKGQQMQPLPPLSVSPLVTTVTGSMSQSIPSVQQVINQPTVLVNALPSPFMLQSQMMTVDGQVVNQNLQMPQIVTGNIISQNQMIDGQEGNRGQGIMPRPALLSPDSGKKKGKKRKAQGQTVASMLHIAAQHSPGNVLVQHSTQQQQQQQFPTQGFQVSPNGNISAAPMLQALTIVSGKGGTPSHIVMNGQGNGNFGSQQIITNSQGGQHINLLQPVNLLNGTTSVVQNFPTFQQFIVPGLGNMVMTSDGTAILQDASNMPMQLQIQNVNGQNVLTPIQNQGILTAGATGMVIRTQNPNSKIIQSQHSPGAQFLSPTGGQIVMGGSPFGGQLSPLVAGVSPNHSVTFNTSPQRVRPNIQQEFIQCNQMGQTLMLPLSPSQIAVSSSSNQQNTTFVQQNTTIVQQQTTMVSNNHNNQFQNNNVGNSNNGMQSSMNDQSIIISQSGKHNNVIKGRQHNILQLQNHPVQMQPQHIAIQNSNEGQSYKRIALQYPQIMNQGNATIKNEPHIQQMISNVNQANLLNQQQNMLHPNVRHSVSTQTLINQQQNGNKSPVAAYNQQVSGCSPPDTTTHSPLGALEGSTSSSPANSISGRSSNSSQGNHVDTTTRSPEPHEQGSLAMVDCISSSEPDSIDNRDSNIWGRSDGITDLQGKCMVSQHIPNQQSQNSFYTVDSSGIHFNNQTITVSSVNNQQNLTITPANYYQKVNSKRNIQNSIMMMSANNQMSPEKMSNKGMVNAMGADAQNQMTNIREQMEKNQHHARHNMTAGDVQRNFNNMDGIAAGNGIKRISVSSANDTSTEDSANVSNASDSDSHPDGVIKPFKEGDLVWGPAKGYTAWPGKIVSKNQVNGKEDGKVLVRWFGGDKCLTVVDSLKLQTLSEGLEAHHAARTKCRKSRKLNGQLEKAIQEAMGELDLITESPDVNQAGMRSTKVDSSFIETGEAAADTDSSEASSATGKNSGKQNISALTSKNTENKGRAWKNASSKSTRNNNTGSVVKIAPHPLVSAITMSMTSESSKGRLRSSHR